ncbi:PAS domain S-box protein [candidate division KSB1 bacterium]|nr:PAS domain S-box protein [candidate division KSB1 bacterium]
MFTNYKWNFVFVVLLVSLIGFIIFDIILIYSIRTYLFRQTFDEMHIKTDLTLELLEEKQLFPLSSKRNELHEFVSQIKTIVYSRVTIIDANGRVLSDSDVENNRIPFLDNHINRPEVKGAQQTGWGQSYRLSDTVNRKLFYTAFQIEHEGEKVGFLRLAYYAFHFENSMNRIFVFILLANFIGLIILFIAAMYLGTLVTFPILRIVRIAQKISSGNFERSFPTNRKDEIGILSQILNQLTDRLKNQIELLSYERSKLENILTNLNSGIVAIDANKKILHVNPEFCSILRETKEEIINKRIDEILEWEAILNPIGCTLKNERPETGEFIYYIETGKVFLSYIVSPFFISKDEKIGALIQIQDISELKYLEAIRRSFVASASHELKTPLTAIVGYAETLFEGAVQEPEARKHFLNRILAQARRLEYLVSDLLKLSQLEHDIPLEVDEIELIPFLQKIIDEFADKANQKKIYVSLEPFNQQIMVKADEELMRTVFENLIDNALKYTPTDGQVKIKVNPSDKESIKIEVLDTGIGIDPKYHDRIFQRFYRVDKARSRELGGTGLGLAIVKHIIERHSSVIFVRSEPGKGSCFCFDLETA